MPLPKMTASATKGAKSAKPGAKGKPFGYGTNKKAKPGKK